MPKSRNIILTRQDLNQLLKGEKLHFPPFFIIEVEKSLVRQRTLSPVKAITIAGFYALVCFSIYILTLILFLPKPAQAQIKAPTVVDIYTPIVVESASEAQLNIWNILPIPTTISSELPPEPQFLTLNDNKTLHIWAAPGKYTIKLTAISASLNTDVNPPKIDMTYNVYHASIEVLAHPPPIPPNPPPTPPTPTPTPTPTAFKTKVQNALTKVNPSFSSFKKQIGENYAKVASSAENNPSAFDPATMIDVVKSYNAQVLPVEALRGWSPFWPLLATALVELSLESTDLQGHIKAFRDIASVLNSN